MDLIDCPYCDFQFEDNAEYVDVGVGGPGVQVTGAVCTRCGASQRGAYKERSGPEVAFSWFPPHSYMTLGSSEPWFEAMINRIFAEGVRYGFAQRTGAPHDSLAPALTVAPELTAADVPF